MGGKLRVARSESGAKVILECGDCTFCGIAAVGVRGNKFEVNVLFAECFLHGVGALVVKDEESGGCTLLV